MNHGIGPRPSLKNAMNVHTMRIGRTFNEEFSSVPENHNFGKRYFYRCIYFYVRSESWNYTNYSTFFFNNYLLEILLWFWPIHSQFSTYNCDIPISSIISVYLFFFGKYLHFLPSTAVEKCARKFISQSWFFLVTIFSIEYYNESFNIPIHKYRKADTTDKCGTVLWGKLEKSI